MGKQKRHNAFRVYNNETYLYYYNLLKNIALVRAKWHGLPETVSERFLETTLYYSGQALYFKDEVIGECALRVSWAGNWNVYGEPTRRIATGANGYRVKRTFEDSVLVLNNRLFQPTEPTIRYYARRLADLERTADTNVFAQKTPVLLVCDEKEKLALENLFMQYQGNKPVIKGYSDINGSIKDRISALNLEAPFVADKLELLKSNILNQALTFLGITNSFNDKRERKNTAEIEANYSSVDIQRAVFLETRKQAAEEISKMFNREVTVTFNEDLENSVNATDFVGNGGAGFERVYNPTKVDNPEQSGKP